MKKRLLLMLIAVVCLSPSIVFATTDADIGYVSQTHLISYTRTPAGIVSVPGGPGSLGSFGAPLRPDVSAGNVAGEAFCPIAAERHTKNLQIIQKNTNPLTPEVSGNAVGS